MILSEYPLLHYVFLATVVFIMGFRLLIPIKSKANYMNTDVNDETKEEYRSSRNHNITLASFSIAAIALVSSRNDLSSLDLQMGIAYLSGAMFCFFIGSYMYIFLQKKNKFPYVGETLEFVGIIALGIGFFYLIVHILPESVLLEWVYGIALIALVGVATYELYVNARYFHPKPNKNK